MKRVISCLFFISIVTACQQAYPAIGPTFTPVVNIVPTSELAPYYGEPQPAKITVDGKTYDSIVGTAIWITDIQPDGSPTTMWSEPFAIITSIEPIIIKPSFSFTLELPIPINPTGLSYTFFKISEQELNSQEEIYGAYYWDPDYKTQTYQDRTLPLLAKQQLSFSFEPGIYVLEVSAGWGGSELIANYGFLLKIIE